MRVNLALLAMIIVDMWLVYSICTLTTQESQDEFYEYLAEEIIDKDYDNVATCRHRNNNLAERIVPASSPIHYTPTTRKRKNRDGSYTNHIFQGRYRECKKKSKFSTPFQFFF